MYDCLSLPRSFNAQNLHISQRLLRILPFFSQVLLSICSSNPSVLHVKYRNTNKLNEPSRQGLIRWLFLRINTSPFLLLNSPIQLLQSPTSCQHLQPSSLSQLSSSNRHPSIQFIHPIHRCILHDHVSKHRLYFKISGIIICLQWRDLEGVDAFGFFAFRCFEVYLHLLDLFYFDLRFPGEGTVKEVFPYQLPILIIDALVDKFISWLLCKLEFGNYFANAPQTVREHFFVAHQLGKTVCHFALRYLIVDLFFVFGFIQLVCVHFPRQFAKQIDAHVQPSKQVISPRQFQSMMRIETAEQRGPYHFFPFPWPNMSPTDPILFSQSEINEANACGGKHVVSGFYISVKVSMTMKFLEGFEGQVHNSQEHVFCNLIMQLLVDHFLKTTLQLVHHKVGALLQFHKFKHFWEARPFQCTQDLIFKQKHHFYASRVFLCAK